MRKLWNDGWKFVRLPVGSAKSRIAAAARHARKEGACTSRAAQGAPLLRGVLFPGM